MDDHPDLVASLTAQLDDECAARLTEQMKKRLVEVWKEVESEGPDRWWKSERQKPVRGGKLNY